MNNIYELNVPSAAPSRHPNTHAAALRKSAPARRPETDGLTQEQLRKIVVDLIG